MQFQWAKAPSGFSTNETLFLFKWFQSTQFKEQTGFNLCKRKQTRARWKHTRMSTYFWLHVSVWLSEQICLFLNWMNEKSSKYSEAAKQKQPVSLLKWRQQIQKAFLYFTGCDIKHAAVLWNPVFIASLSAVFHRCVNFMWPVTQKPRVPIESRAAAPVTPRTHCVLTFIYGARVCVWE